MVKEGQHDLIKNISDIKGTSRPIQAIHFFCCSNGLPKPDFNLIRLSKGQWKVTANVNSMVSFEETGKFLKAKTAALQIF